MPDVSVLDDLCSRWGSDVIFSLDLKNGRPLAWSDKVSEVINLVTKVGVERMLILDLATVGTHAGPSTLNQCRQLKVSHPALRLLTGGGIRNEEDLRAVEESGVESVLVASALHDGSLDSLRKS